MSEHPQAASTAAQVPSEHRHPNPKELEAINSAIRYAMYSVFRVDSDLVGDRAAMIAETEAFFAGLDATGVEVRGIYDVSLSQAEADVLIWWHAESVEPLQAAARKLRSTAFGRHLARVWTGTGIHRPAEFNRAHVPDFLAGAPAKDYVAVYPFVRSYEWYLLSASLRRAILREHGQAARDYEDVRANTLTAFALGDYEWLLAFESNQLHRIVDLMRELRAVEARRHVREEVPFYTGPRISVSDLIAQLP